jgi:hypothetical protein
MMNNLDLIQRAALIASLMLPACAADGAGSKPSGSEAADGAAAASASVERTSEPANRPRDPEIAVREEFRAAEEAGTVEAYELFVRRHPDHRLAETARKRIRELESGK